MLAGIILLFFPRRWARFRRFLLLTFSLPILAGLLNACGKLGDVDRRDAARLIHHHSQRERDRQCGAGDQNGHDYHHRKVVVLRCTLIQYLERKMMWLCKCSAGAALLLVMSAGVSAYSQSVPDGFKDNPSLWVGIEYANVRAGFPHGSNLRLSGLGGLVSFSWTHQLLIEGQARYLNWNRWYGESEQDYLAGPRYTFLRSQRVRPFARFEVGAIRVRYPFRIGTGRRSPWFPVSASSTG